MIIGVHEFWSFLLIFARITAMLLTAPAFGARSIPATVKIGLAGLVSLTLLPLVSPQVHGAPADIVTLTGQITAETVVGLCLGLLVQIVFLALQITGSFADTQMGFNMINVLNPVSEQQTSATGQFMYQLGLTVFLLMGGHLYLISALASSFQTVPAGGAHFSGNMANVMIGMVGQMFLLAFRIAAPVAGVLMVVDVAFSIVARTVPQMNVFIVGMPLKVIIGLTTLAFVLPAVALVVGQFLPVIGSGASAVLQAAK